MQEVRLPRYVLLRIVALSRRCPREPLILKPGRQIPPERKNLLQTGTYGFVFAGLMGSHPSVALAAADGAPEACKPRIPRGFFAFGPPAAAAIASQISGSEALSPCSLGESRPERGAGQRTADRQKVEAANWPQIRRISPRPIVRVSGLARPRRAVRDVNASGSPASPFLGSGLPAARHLIESAISAHGFPNQRAVADRPGVSKTQVTRSPSAVKPCCPPWRTALLVRPRSAPGSYSP
jgi:hypothetical protein